MLLVFCLFLSVTRSSPPFLLPSGAPDDAYDSIKYGSLIRQAHCPDALGRLIDLQPIY